MDNSPKQKKLGPILVGSAVLGTLVLPFTVDNGVWIALIILLLLLSFMGAYFWWLNRGKKSILARFISALTGAEHPAGAEMTEQQWADIDKLRRRFTEGIAIYKSRGKDIYSVPWYLIIGESGSGKTAAIRRSNLDFPVGLQDEMQGFSGTVNMDWWFTNHGVVLDTAGKMVFPEVKSPVASKPWEEFLKLLKKHRPQCPINGLLLVLSVDSLISDSAEKIREKAGAMAHQLDLIQRTLDVRFPVWLLVTKCDMLTGFREFFQTVNDPELQDQIIGWSNPDPLDQPFRPDLVEEHLTQLADKLQRRRLWMLKNLLPSGGPRSRRLDEVDALYALPQSLQLIAPRLNRYLEAIFVAREFAPKPVFMRGIYFTSALQIGRDLDLAVANALNLPPSALAGDLSDQSSDDLGKPFFLRHLFLEKIFQERGLVTRATNTQRMLRNRQLKVMAGSLAFLLLLPFFSWRLSKQFQASLQQNRTSWNSVLTLWTNPNYWNNGAWLPIVTKKPGSNWLYDYVAAAPEPKLTNKSILQIHDDIRIAVAHPLDVPWLFRPLNWFRSTADVDKSLAQRTVLEHSLIYPVIKQAREKMAANDQSFHELARWEEHTAALKVLLQLESEKKRRLRPKEMSAVTNLLNPLLAYLTETSQLLDPVLAQIVLDAYSGRQASWPPPGIKTWPDKEAQPALARGLDNYYRLPNRVPYEIGSQWGGFTNIQTLSALAKKYRGPDKSAFKTFVLDHLQPAETSATNEYLTAYINYVIAFPDWSQSSDAAMTRVHRLVMNLRQDIQALDKVPAAWNYRLQQLLANSNKRYETHVSNYLHQNLAFPAVWQSAQPSAPLTANKVSQLYANVRLIRSAWPQGTNAPASNSLPALVEGYAAALAVLDNPNATCSFRIPHRPFWSQCPYVRVISGSLTNQNEFFPPNENELEFKDLALAPDLQIHYNSSNRDWKKKPLDFGPWGILELLRQCKGAPNPTNAAFWEGTLDVGIASVPVRVKFNSPPPANWPSLRAP